MATATRDVGQGRLAAAAGLAYLVQGVLYGFAGYAMIPQLAHRGVSLAEQTGIVALAGAPWVLKLAWAPLLDRVWRTRPGRWLQLGLLTTGLASLGLSQVLAGQAWPIALAWLLVNVALSLQDVATDALVLDRARSNARGWMVGIMLGAHHLGAEGIGGLGLGLWAAAAGLGVPMLVFGGVVIASALVVPRTDVASHAPTPSTPAGASWGRGFIVTVLVASLAVPADALTSAVSGALLVTELGWTPERIAARLPVVALVANVAGYGLASLASDRLGHGKTAAMGSAALGVLWLGFGLVPAWWSSEATIFGLVGAQGLVTALLFVGLHAALMDAVSPTHRATHFAVFMAALNLPRIWAPPLGPALLGIAGWPGLFMVCGGYQLAFAGLVVVYWKATTSDIVSK